MRLLTTEDEARQIEFIKTIFKKYPSEGMFLFGYAHRPDFSKFDGQLPMELWIPLSVILRGLDLWQPPEPEPPMGWLVKIIASPFLNIRAEPRASSQDLGDIKFGERVAIIRQEGEWLKLATRPGWISAPFTEKVV